MRYIKIFEKYALTPSKGDYVYINESRVNKDMLQGLYAPLIYFLLNNIGQITSVREIRGKNKNDICVKYYNVPDNLKKNFRTKTTKNGISYYGFFTINDVVAFSHYKGDLEGGIEYCNNIKKYNL